MKVYIEVSGGVVQVVSGPPGLEVVLMDYDNADGDPESRTNIEQLELELLQA